MREQTRDAPAVGGAHLVGSLPDGASDVRSFLIADVRGYTRFTLERGDAAAGRLTARFADLTEEVVTAHDGAVTEVHGDEALAVFHSARQAINAAVGLQERFGREVEIDPSLPLRVGMGLDAGEAVRVKDGYRGTALNLAARLCALAGPGEILVSEALTHLAGRVEGVDYRPRGATQLKGFDAPVDVFAVVPSRPESDWTSVPAPDGQVWGAPEQHLPVGGFLGALPAGPLVARDAEVGEALSPVQAVLRGEGRTVLLTGEPGAGKTRLAQEMTLRLRNQGFLIAAGRCYEAEAAVPYYPFQDALAAVYTQASLSLRRAVAGRWPYLGALLPEQLGVPEVAGGPDEQLRVVRAAADFITTVAVERPVALLLDDLHWADSASLRLLLHLARHTRSSRVFVLGTYRDVEVGRQHPLEGTLRELNREGLAERIQLRRLTQEGTARLIAVTMGEEEVSEELAQLVHSRTEGNPFFVQQVMRSLVERGDVFIRGGRWDRKDIDAIEVPESVRAVIGQRLARLSQAAQNVLGEASVLGQTFRFDDLLTMTGRPEEEIEAALEEAGYAGLVKAADAEVFSFDHALTQGALYAELAPRRRRKLHRAAGEAIEQVGERDRRGPAGDGRAGELAWHFLRGDDDERAMRYSLLAGDRAEAVFAHDEAEMHYRTALELAQELESGREAEALEKLGAVLTRVAHLAEAEELLEAARRRYRAAGDREGDARAAAQLANLYFRRGDYSVGVALLRSFLAEREGVGNEGPSPGLARVWAQLASLLSNQSESDPAGALAAAERAGELAQELEDQRLLAAAGMQRGLALYNLGRLAEAQEVLRRTVALAEATGELEALLRSLHLLAYADAQLGDTTTMRPYHERALEIAQRVADPHWVVSEGIWLATVAFAFQGDWTQAKADLTQTMRTLQRMGTSELASLPGVFLSYIHLVEGDEDEALRQMAEAESFSESLVVGAKAAHALIKKQYDVAIDLLEPVLSAPDLLAPHLASVLTLLADAYLGVGEIDRAEALVKRALEQAERLGGGPDWVGVLVIGGKVKTARGAWAEAAEAFDDALVRLEPWPDSPDRGRVLHEYGLMEARRGERAAAQERLEQALGIFQRLGAQLLMERTERALKDL